ncbi:UNKNOWN [Stylonychia lemnae]|uniref:Uncharacterized protein n=1 Tax=Stylonychia lemnae TaxID=5949 RepID=A0A078AKC5_STYLE|nr:UNKNOWN [Stylonychia lemnae]|eukprot:CDW81263.1 UNKNOWN [Stylonychia lemnae]
MGIVIALILSAYLLIRFTRMKRKYRLRKALQNADTNRVQGAIVNQFNPYDQIPDSFDEQYGIPIQSSATSEVMEGNNQNQYAFDPKNL